MTTFNKLLAFTLLASSAICAEAKVQTRVDNQSADTLFVGYGYLSSTDVGMSLFDVDARTVRTEYLPVPNSEAWLVAATKNRVCVSKLPFSRQNPPKRGKTFIMTLGAQDQCPHIEYGDLTETMRLAHIG